MRYGHVTKIALVALLVAACGAPPGDVVAVSGTTTTSPPAVDAAQLTEARQTNAAIERAYEHAAFVRAATYAAAVAEAERLEAERVAAERAAQERAAQEAAERAERERQARVQSLAASAPVVAGGSPSSNRALGADMAAARGWSGDQWSCLDALWSHESGWRHDVWNRQGSGAYGIPQALPGSKMSSHGADWQTNPATQIAWGLDYIAGRYGTPCGARAHSLRVGWY